MKIVDIDFNCQCVTNVSKKAETNAKFHWPSPNRTQHQLGKGQTEKDSLESALRFIKLVWWSQGRRELRGVGILRVNVFFLLSLAFQSASFSKVSELTSRARKEHARTFKEEWFNKGLSVYVICQTVAWVNIKHEWIMSNILLHCFILKYQKSFFILISLCSSSKMHPG